MLSIPSINTAKKQMERRLKAAKADPAKANEVMLLEIVVLALTEYGEIVAETNRRRQSDIQIDRCIAKLMSGIEVA